MRHVTSQGESQGGRLKRLLDEKKMTITQLAKKSGVDRSALTNIANDEIGLGPKRAQKIADALKKPLDEVLIPKPERVTLQSLAERVRRLEIVAIGGMKDQDTGVTRRQRDEALAEIASIHLRTQERSEGSQ